MSLKKFANLIQQGTLGKADKQWFPAWPRRFAEFAGSDDRSQIPLTKELALGFSRQLLASGIPAWQRHQAIRTLAAYRNLILKTPGPLLMGMIRTLRRLADQEKSFAAGTPDSRDQRAIVEQIDPGEHLVVQQMRREMRVRGMALDSERAYVGWVGRRDAPAGVGVVSLARPGRPVRRWRGESAEDGTSCRRNGRFVL